MVKQLASSKKSIMKLVTECSYFPSSAGKESELSSFTSKTIMEKNATLTICRLQTFCRLSNIWRLQTIWWISNIWRPEKICRPQTIWRPSNIGYSIYTLHDETFYKRKFSETTTKGYYDFLKFLTSCVRKKPPLSVCFPLSRSSDGGDTGWKRCIVTRQRRRITNPIKYRDKGRRRQTLQTWEDGDDTAKGRLKIRILWHCWLVR